MPSEIVQAWTMSCEATRFLLDSLPAGSLDDAYAPRVRPVRRQFAHLHDVRLRWPKHAAPAHAKGLTAFGKARPDPTKAELRRALGASEKAVAAFLEACAESGRVPGWKGPPATFLGYLVAHEAHHRGLVNVALRASGRKLPQEVVYGLWDWGKPRSARRGRAAATPGRARWGPLPGSRLDGAGPSVPPLRAPSSHTGPCPSRPAGSTLAV